MYCRNCGKEIEEGIAFCPYCGAQQNGTIEERLVQPSKEKKSYLKYIIIVLAAVACIVGGVFIYKNTIGKPSEEELFKKALVSNSYSWNAEVKIASMETLITFYDNGTVKWEGEITVGSTSAQKTDQGTYTIDYENKTIYTTFNEGNCTITSCGFEYDGDEVVLIINDNEWTPQ